MLEKHPFKPFTPPKSKYLILGSFPGKGTESDWYYGSTRNQFWRIIENVYSKKLYSKKDKQELFTLLKIAITDVISECIRVKNSNLDINLKELVYNDDVIEKILKKNKIEKIYFTGRYVEKIYRSKIKFLYESFPDIELITLPSPSPRYAGMTIEQKVDIYNKLMPKDY